jgi:LPXTG-site transpeptidase (sortase) family protein
MLREKSNSFDLANVSKDFRKIPQSLQKRAKLIDPRTSRTIIGLVFVFFGLLFLFKLPVPKTTAVDLKEPIVASKDFKPTKDGNKIVRILVPKNNIDLPVKFSKIVQGYWETSENSASHGEGSAVPGEKGNVVVFAHARIGLFYDLKDVKKDDVVYLFTKEKWHRYKVAEIKTVYPNDITVIQPTKDEVLTLFTCSGFFDEKRLIVKALPDQKI